MVLRMAAVPLALLALPPFHSSITPLSPSARIQIRAAGEWHKGCPVALSDLRLLAVSHRGFDGRVHTGRLVVNKSVAADLAGVFSQLYHLRYPIRHMRFSDVYGNRGERPRDGDVSGSFECRQAVPSPCTGGRGTGTWSNHAFGLAVDLNPRENPYVGCGQSRDPHAKRYFDRSRRLRGMVTPKVIGAFRSIGWGWGGAWMGSTKDYMHFSYNGH
jgi:hypothetical protein